MTFRYWYPLTTNLINMLIYIGDSCNKVSDHLNTAWGLFIYKYHWVVIWKSTILVFFFVMQVLCFKTEIMEVKGWIPSWEGGVGGWFWGLKGECCSNLFPFKQSMPSNSFYWQMKLIGTPSRLYSSWVKIHVRYFNLTDFCEFF